MRGGNIVPKDVSFVHTLANWLMMLVSTKTFLELISFEIIVIFSTFTVIFVKAFNLSALVPSISTVDAEQRIALLTLIETRYSKDSLQKALEKKIFL